MATVEGRNDLGRQQAVQIVRGENEVFAAARAVALPSIRFLCRLPKAPDDQRSGLTASTGA